MRHSGNIALVDARLVVLAVSLALTLGAWPTAAAAAPPGPGPGPVVKSHGRFHRQICGATGRGLARCHSEVVADANGAPVAAATPAGYGPADLQSAYKLTGAAASNGGNQTIGIVDAYNHPNAEADLGVYRSQYGLPPCTTANGCFRKVDQNGGTSYPADNASWAQEISLDLDMASATCPKCHILLVEAASNSFANLAMAVDRAALMGATQISNSYGGGEYAAETSDQSHYNHPGIAITASSGDSGYGVSFPAASRYVTAVGGTSLNRNAATSRGWSETAWSGAGSGCSAYVTKPSWQADTGCTRRTVADQSAVADPNTGVAVYDSFPFQGASGWLVFGGTSVAAPVIAGVDALIGPAAAANYGSYPYDHPSWFFDVTSGSNGSCGGSYLCTAVPGYDGPTGIGTPNGATQPPTAVTGSASSIGPSTATVSGTVNPNGQATTYHFDYGTTTGYGAQAPAPPDPSAGSGTTNQSVSANLTGLTASTTYHYRLVATNASGTTTAADQTFITTSGNPSPPGDWVGTFGSDGYDLAAWDSSNDLAHIPNASVTLVQGGRYQWDGNTSDGRALQSPDKLVRHAATYYDAGQIVVQLNFTSAYSGNLHLYAVDWDSPYRRETISVGGQTASLTSDFSQGAWLAFPINVPAGGSVTVTVTRTAGVNAVLSGMFLGEAGPPPAVPVSSSPQGSWVGAFGSAGYDLAAWDGANDLAYIPNASVSLVSGNRYVWARNIADPRALQNPNGSPQTAATYYDGTQIRVRLVFTAAYTGNLRLYAVDWDSTARRETISVGGKSVVLSGDFSQGAWAAVPINVPAGGSLDITVDRTAGVNAVLSGVFLGDAGSPPSVPVSTAPQGNWVGTFGFAGYDLGAWNGSSDLVNMPNASLNVQAGRYVWDGNTVDVRALQSPDTSTRKAATYYDWNQLTVQLNFSAAYSGTLRLYAVDWDSTARRETISIGGQTARLSTDFSQGAWVAFPISVPAGGSVTITVDRTAGANAVVSGVFLG